MGLFLLTLILNIIAAHLDQVHAQDDVQSFCIRRHGKCDYDSQCCMKRICCASSHRCDNPDFTVDPHKMSENKKTPLLNPCVPMSLVGEPTMQPPTTTEQPISTTEKPNITKRPQFTTEPPKFTTKQPIRTTKQPIRTTKQPIRTTKKPIRTTKQPIRTTKQPRRTTKKTKQENKPTGQTPGQREAC